jgi:hypothetical protein
MVPNINTILQRFTGEWAILLQPEAILTVCREIRYTTWRDRVLTPVTTMQLFLLQILHGNTACSHQPHLSVLRFTAEADCQARAGVPLLFFDLLLKRFSCAVQRSALGDERGHGHRTFLVDGLGCSMPDTPALQDAFGQSTGQRPGCGFPVTHPLGLFYAGTGVLLKLVVAPLPTHDLAGVQTVHPALQPGGLLVADRGPCSYAHLALLVQAVGAERAQRLTSCHSGMSKIHDRTATGSIIRPLLRYGRHPVIFTRVIVYDVHHALHLATLHSMQTIASGGNFRSVVRARGGGSRRLPWPSRGKKASATRRSSSRIAWA